MLMFFVIFLKIKFGNFKYSFGNGGNIVSFEVKFFIVFDGEWYNVIVFYVDKSVMVMLDGNIYLKLFESLVYDFFGKNIRIWFFGGYDLFMLGLNLVNFFGCMEDLNIDGLYVLFLGFNKFVVIFF